MRAAEDYIDREQTRAKHFILRRYLQALSFKVLRHWDITYVDGFSGPWKSERSDFSDTSFMIAINVLKDAQRRVQDQTGVRRTIKCFFAESNATSYRQLADAVAPHNQLSSGFQVRTFHGEFEDAVSDIRMFAGSSFPLIFIDPTGWTGFAFTKISPLFDPPKCEVIINFMYSFVTRFLTHPDAKIIASLDPILGGPGWKSRLDPQLSSGPAVEKLFRETLKIAGKFAHVVSTKIDKSAEDRPHFFLAYGTKDRAGLKAFRETEYEALREHARNRSAAKSRRKENRTGSLDLFSAHDADVQKASIDVDVAEQKRLARLHLVQVLGDRGPLPFPRVVDLLLQIFMLRETNVKDICVDLSREGKIAKTWGAGSRKPMDNSIIGAVLSKS